MIPIRLSIIMPAYNEEDSICLAVEDIFKDVLRIKGLSSQNVELLVVNDGSKDQTGAILEDLKNKFIFLKPIHQKNAGHGGALINGLNAARGEYVFLIDSDRQVPTSNFENLWISVERGFEGAFGVRRQRHDPKARLLLTKIIRAFIWIAFGVSIFDANVPFKVFKRDFWLRNQKFIPQNTLAPSLFLAVLAKKQNLKLQEIEVTHKIREAGVGSLNYQRLFKFCCRALGQLLKFRKDIRG